MVVWGILYSVEPSQKSIGFPLLLVAWTVTEIIRYLYYIVNLAKVEANVLTWLRLVYFYTKLKIARDQNPPLLQRA